MNKNDEIILDITDVTDEGSGIGKVDGMVVFVPFTAIGDTVKVKIVKLKKNYCFGKLLEIITPSADRIAPDCETFNKCGGCAFRHISYEAECKIKYKKVYETVKRIGGIDLLPEPIISADNINYYRNKAQLPLNSDGKAGFFAPRSHRIIPNNACLLQPAEFSDIIKTIENWISDNNISIYNEEAKKGLLRHIYLRKAQKTDEICLTLIINGDSLPYNDDLIARLKPNENIKSIGININKIHTNVITGDKCKTLYGNDYITDILCNIKVRLSPLSFYQVNRDMAEKLYLNVREYANPENKNILDLYCGAGTIGLSMAKNAKSIIGVEIVSEAIADAKHNAQLNGIINARFICADATVASRTLAEEKIKPDVCIVDPPRKGCSEEVINTIAKEFSPESVVYVSCDVSTLARDIKLFDALGYKLIKYTPCDLFPRTPHIECVALLCKATQ